MIADYIIPLNGARNGKWTFSWHVGKEFFADFENTDILDSDVNAEAVLERSGDYIGIDCELNGEVKVPCDRCLEELSLPVDNTIRLSIKFGEDSSESEGTEDEGRETVIVSDEGGLDMAQIIYDYICLSLPLQRVHQDGECNEEMLKYLSNEEDEAAEVKETGEEVEDSPFAVLKGLFGKE